MDLLSQMEWIRVSLAESKEVEFFLNGMIVALGLYVALNIFLLNREE